MITYLFIIYICGALASVGLIFVFHARYGSPAKEDKWGLPTMIFLSWIGYIVGIYSYYECVKNENQ